MAVETWARFPVRSFFDCLLIQSSSLPFTHFYFLTVCSYTARPYLEGTILLLTVCSYAWLVLHIVTNHPYVFDFFLATVTGVGEVAQAFCNHASGADSRARRARNAEAHARREPSSRAVFTEGSRVAWEDDASASSVVHWSSLCLKTRGTHASRHPTS